MAANRVRVPRAAREVDTSLDLVRRARAGDREAENRICELYLPRLHRWARGRLPRGARPAMETGDLVQDVLSRAIRSFPAFEPRHDGAFPAYLRRILANKIADLGRLDQRRPAPSVLDSGFDLASSADTPFEETVKREEKDRYERGLQRLSPRNQDLIFLRLELGYGYDEIARILGSTPNAVRVATRRAMVRLAREMSIDSSAA
jgi:RNA polymerase sigma-70 factor (ECF subfamily)